MILEGGHCIFNGLRPSKRVGRLAKRRLAEVWRRIGGADSGSFVHLGLSLQRGRVPAQKVEPDNLFGSRDVGYEVTQDNESLVARHAHGALVHGTHAHGHESQDGFDPRTLASLAAVRALLGKSYFLRII